MMNFREFYQTCESLSQQHSIPTIGYLDEHALRFYRTYQTCARHLQPGASLLSIGAGWAFIEGVLAREKKTQITVLDFPGTLESQESFYSSIGFHAIGADFTQYEAPEGAEQFDMILSSEVVEHIPEAPSKHIARFRPHLKKGGVLVITTPNFGNVRNLVKFAFHHAVLEKPEYSFLPPSFESQRYHRREYMTSEMKRALEICQLQSEKFEFSMNPAKKARKDLLFAPIETLVPFWRRTQIVTARAV